MFTRFIEQDKEIKELFYQKSKKKKKEKNKNKNI